MKIVGKDYGYMGRIFQFESGKNVNQRSGIQIALDNMPVDTGDGNQLGITAILVQLPTISFTQPINTYSDGVTLCQLISNINLRLADGTPPTKWEGGGTLLNGDFYRVGSALAWLSGAPLFPFRGRDQIDADTAPAADITSLGGFANAKIGTEIGFPWNQIPMAAADATTAAVSFRPFVALPVGLRADEDPFDTAIPANWFARRYYEGKECSSGAGQLNFDIANTVDNVAFTIGSEGISLFAVGIAYPCDRTPLPTVPSILATTTSNRNFRLRRGIRKMFAFMKGLTSAGAQQTHSYTTVDVQSEGTSIVNPNVAFQLAQVSYNGTYYHRNGWFSVPIGGTALSFRAQTRNTLPWVPLLAYTGKDSHSPGSVNNALVVDISTTAETVFDYVDVTLTPNTDSGAEEARKLANQPQGMVFAASDNGNLVDPSSPLFAALPQKIITTHQ